MRQSFFIPSMILSIFSHGLFITVGGWLPVKPQVSVLEAPNSLEITVIKQPVVSVLENEITVEAVVDRAFLDEVIVSHQADLKDISQKFFYSNPPLEKSPSTLLKMEPLSHENPTRHYPSVYSPKSPGAVSQTGTSSEDPLSIFSKKSQGAETQAKPLIHVNPAPDYPALARQRGWEGIVRLNVLVAQDGSPRQVSIQQGSGHGLLDKAAVKAVEDWKFSPAQSGSLRFVSRVIIPIQFSLINQ